MDRMVIFHYSHYDYISGFWYWKVFRSDRELEDFFDIKKDLEKI